MDKLNELLAKLAKIDEKIDALLAGDSLSDEQQTEHDALVADRERAVKAIDNEKGRLARIETREKLSIEIKAIGDTGNGRKSTADVPQAPNATAVKRDADGRVTSFIEDTDESVTLRIGEAADAQRRLSYKQQKKENLRQLKSFGYQPWGEFKSFQEFVEVGMSGASRQHSMETRLHRHYAAIQGMNEVVGSDGGYMVMPEFANGIIDRVYANDLWGRTDNYSVTGNSMTFLTTAETSRATGSRAGGLRGYWLGEGATATASRPKLREVSLKLVKLGVLVYMTQELLEDGGAALQSYVARKAAEEFSFMLGDSLIEGTGVGQPLGILNAPSLVSVAKEGGQLAATLETENIEKMYARFYAPNIGGMVWLHNQDILPELNTMTLGVGTGGVPTYLPPGGMSSAPYGMLKGRPLLPTEFNSTLGTQGDIIAADLGQMLSISKGGIAQAVSMHVEFLTQQLALLFTMRVNATPWESAPITPFKGTANTQSSFVTLDTRA